VEKRRPEKRRIDKRQIGLIGLAGVGGVFAALNLDEVEVNWILGTWDTPLIVVIALSMLIGGGLGYLTTRRRRS
jgi:uncharacterized integral membrane protein